MSSQYKSISRRTRGLLASGESNIVDYKEHVKGLQADDLVAFANSDSGGVILIGVREARSANGAQIGTPVGHVIDDGTRLQIVSKALSCSPPIQIEVIVENTASKPFYRIEIPSGALKPYATGNGAYKIREDGRNNPLYPQQLLALFLEREGEEFQRRFIDATARLDGQMMEALKSVGKLEGVISSKIEDIGHTLGWAEHKAGNASDTIDDVYTLVSSLIREGRDHTDRLRAIAKKVEAEDPVKRKAADEVRANLVEKLKKSPEALDAILKGKHLSVSFEGTALAELDADDLRRLLTEAAKLAADRSKDDRSAKA